MPVRAFCPPAFTIPSPRDHNLNVGAYGYTRCEICPVRAFCPPAYNSSSRDHNLNVGATVTPGARHAPTPRCSRCPVGCGDAVYVSRTQCTAASERSSAHASGVGRSKAQSGRSVARRPAAVLRKFVAMGTVLTWHLGDATALRPAPSPPWSANSTHLASGDETMAAQLGSRLTRCLGGRSLGPCISCRRRRRAIVDSALFPTPRRAAAKRGLQRFLHQLAQSLERLNSTNVSRKPSAIMSSRHGQSIGTPSSDIVTTCPHSRQMGGSTAGCGQASAWLGPAMAAQGGEGKIARWSRTRYVRGWAGDVVWVRGNSRWTTYLAQWVP
ncbi:hypothetical protein HPB48_017165 [Haemaphysalis longicornis]|uniref:Uncharacterized protein n=1 Tax=Haemaphysalis longicornis TaxID=44386 RepID=A0A9J6GKR2_HAELO|nr:hypothetical protein HPB48_017165 [Haemaphysalis longicornis]